MYAQEVMDYILIYKELQSLLRQIPFTDINLFDLLVPTQVRTQRILSAIISAFSLKEEYSKHFESFMPVVVREKSILEKEFDNLSFFKNKNAKEERELSARLESLVIAKRNLEPKSIQDELEYQKWEEQNQELEETLRELRKICDGIMAKHEELKVERHGLKDSLVKRFIFCFL